MFGLLRSRKGFQWSRKTYFILLVGGIATATAEAFAVPEKLCSSFGSYPNPLRITEDDRASFHPVIKFPTIKAESSSGEKVEVPDVTVRDLTLPTDLVYIVTEGQQNQRRKEAKSQGSSPKQKEGVPDYNIGRYDEDRRGLYVSDMFEKEAAGARTVHVGIDLGGPIGTDVHAFENGVVHSIGYNPQLGDYGNVIVIEHTIPSCGEKVWALYGHLDGSTLDRGNHPGKPIAKGQVIGRLGDIYENGGWYANHARWVCLDWVRLTEQNLLHICREGAHVHFQLSTEAPETHDMPGAVTLDDRPKALVLYPDPRYVLGILY